MLGVADSEQGRLKLVGTQIGEHTVFWQDTFLGLFCKYRQCLQKQYFGKKTMCEFQAYAAELR